MGVLDRFGIQDEAPFTFTVKGDSNKVLVMDGDGACYASASTCARLDTAKRHLLTKIYEAMFLTKCSTARVHLTPKGCKKNGRDHLIGVKQYQANRDNKRKPALLEALRAEAESLSNDEVELLAHWDVEADDAIMQDAYIFGNNCIVWSPDKDLQIVPSPFYDISTGVVDCIKDRYGWLKKDFTTSGKVKIKGHGTKFFWAQMLMGDTADNVKGLLTYENKLCGPSKAFEVLQDILDESEACNTVLNAYRAIDQNPIPEAEMLWLTRTQGDSALKYMNELKLSRENFEFLKDCKFREYTRKTDIDSDETY